ncbi:MAG: hypothetical protein SX243_18270 [Acidobacteriota bacterium]|nr:hypothetical protein [Acidobacteriota bacterium]
MRWAQPVNPWSLGTLVVLLLLALASAAAAQGVAAQGAGERPAVVERVEELFQVLPLEDGVALVPLSSLNGVRSIEMRGGELAINGASVSEDVVRSWLQDAAPVVLELWRRSPQERRALFGFEPAGAATAPPVVEAPEPPPVAGSPAAGTLVAEEPEAAESAAVAEVSPEEEVVADDELQLEDSPTEESTVEERSWDDEPRADRRPERRTTSSEARSSIGQPLTIRDDEIAEEAVVIGGPLTIDGEVLESAVSIGGPVRIRGKVLGDVAAVGGSVYLEETAEVQGDVTSVGGEVEREDGAKVFGEVSEVAMNWGRFDLDFGDWLHLDDWDPEVRVYWPQGIFARAATFGGNLAWAIFMALLVGLVVVVAKDPVQRIGRVAAAEPWKAGLVGIASLLLLLFLIPIFAIVLVILVITIIGIPIAIILAILVPLALVLMALVGYSAVSLRVGEAAGRRFNWPLANAFLTALLGVALIRGWELLGDLLNLGGWPLFLPAITLIVFGFMVNFVAWSVGTGALLMSVFDGSPRVTGAAALPPVPPPPPPPMASEPPPDDATWDDTALDDLPSEDELEREFEQSLEEDSSADEASATDEEPATDDEVASDEPVSDEEPPDLPEDDGTKPSSEDDKPRG